MNNERRLLVFTDLLCTLCKAGFSLKTAAGKIASYDERKILPPGVRESAREVTEKLLEGKSAGEVFEEITALKVPAWYSAFIYCGQENGSLWSTLEFLKTVLEDRIKRREKILLTLLYPLSVCVISTVLCVLVFNLFMHSGRDEKTLLSAVKNASLFLAVFCPGLVFFLKKIFETDYAAVFFKVLAFCFESGFSMIRCLDCVFFMFRGNEKFEEMILCMRRRIREGEKTSFVFESELKENGFEDARRACSLCLGTAEITGDYSAFEKIYRMLHDKKKRMEEAALSLLNPVLLCGLGFYLFLLLKDTIIPLLSGGSLMI